jgi:hypothetical protein
MLISNAPGRSTSARSAAIRLSLAAMIVSLITQISLRAEMPAKRQVALPATQRGFFENYCVACHNAERREGQLRLDNISLTIDSVEAAERWQKILNQLNSGDMPPTEAKQPESGAKAEFLDTLAKTLVEARKVLSDQGGRIVMRRLNRREYKNTIRDLLGVDIGVKELPADGGAGTFDTVGASLFMSSDQFEQYLAMGRTAIDEHFARYAKPLVPSRMHVECEERNARIEKSLSQRKDDRDRYLKWTAAVDQAAAKPENIDVATMIREEKKGDATHLYFQWQRLKGTPSPKDFGFVDAVNADEMGRRDWVHYVPHHQAYLAQPGVKTGSYLTFDDVFVNPYQPFRVPGDWPPGDYVVRVRIAATDSAPPERRFVEFGSQHDSGVRAVTSSHQVTGTMAQPQVLEIPLKFSPQKGHGFFFQEKGSFGTDVAANQLFAEAKRKNGIGPEFALWLDWIEVVSVSEALLQSASRGSLGATTTTSPKANGTEIDSAAPLKQRREVELHANAMVGGTYNGYFKGGNEAAKEFLATGKPQKGIPDEQEAKFRVKVFEEHGPTFVRYLDDPLTKTGAYLTIFNVHPEEVITLPPDQPSGWLKTKYEVDRAAPGEYVLRFRIGAVAGTPTERHFVAFGSRMKPEEKEDFALIRTFQISGTTNEPQIIEVPMRITTNGPRTFVLRERRDVKLDHEIYTAARKETGVGPVSALWIDWVEWEGPLTAPTTIAPPSNLMATTHGASDRDHARTILERFALRAFRDRQPSSAYIDRLMKLFESRVAAGDRFEIAIREPLRVVLASPGFLYLAEPKSGATSTTTVPVQLTQRELAVRLSYFLWSAPPDEELLELARRGELANADVLARQVDRLIDSPRSSEFISGFVHQWLSMDRLDFFQFDTKLHRDFDDSAKAAARREVYETISYLLRGNEPLSRLLKSDFVVVDGLLATYYGIEGVVGDEFRKVSLPADSPRGGLLGMAAILAMGSNGSESSPVERGAWVLRKLLNDPPPPAPPNVPQISRLEGKLLTTRERLLAHQEQPQCASCHRKIDPIGFGLENFNASGKWRTSDRYEKRGVGKKEWPIDSSGAFHNGPSFADFFALRDIIAARESDFARGFTENLIEYALGRPYGFSDEELAKEIVAAAQSDGFVIRRFLHALIASKAFQHK